jgi:bifunctional DNA-binding transcriptional regulator/antitoxin component of YhaV-PrlF toxin-antitoxin module
MGVSQAIASFHQSDMPTSTLTSCGRIAIAKSIRDAFCLQPDASIEFILEGDQVLLRRAGAGVTELDGMLDRSDCEPASIEAMQAYVERVAG